MPSPGRLSTADFAGVFLNNSVGHRQPKSGALALAFLRAVLGGEEWIVDALDMFLRDAGCRCRTTSTLHGVAIVRAKCAACRRRPSRLWRSGTDSGTPAASVRRCRESAGRFG